MTFTKENISFDLIHFSVMRSSTSLPDKLIQSKVGSSINKKILNKKKTIKKGAHPFST